MAQPISPQIWNKAALADNRLLPARYSIGIFTGKGVNIANNEEAYAYDDILVSDRIFDYDDRRLNGLANVSGNSTFNADGRDGWGASAYGPFQTVRFTRRVFTSGQHKSIAWRVFDEKQYAGGIGQWGDASQSTAYTGGESYLSTAETINKAKSIWDKEILGPHIDKYNFFAIANGHISGRFVQTNAEKGAMFDCEGTWVASPGPYEGLSYPPEFAPIKAIEWDSLNVRPMLNAIDVAWTNLFIPEDNRVILLDKAYKDDLLSNLIGVPGTVPHTDKAYDALVEGRFERFYGWDFDFSIPSQYYPKVYLDANNNVVHSASGTAAYDAILNSISAPDGVLKLQNELAAAARVRATNYIGTYYDTTNKVFVNEITNYPMSMPSGSPYYGTAETVNENNVDWGVPYGGSNTSPKSDKAVDSFPWQGYPGQGIASPTGPVSPIVRRQVIGMAVYRPAAQLGEEYGYMETDRGKTRGKFTELVFDVKHDAWVIPQYSHGILLIVDAEENVGEPAVPVKVVGGTVNSNVEFPETLNVAPASDATFPVSGTVDTRQSQVYGISISDATKTVANGSTFKPTVTVTGYGDFDQGFTATSGTVSVATVADDGTITVVADSGTSVITYASRQDPTKTVTCTVTATAAA